MGSAIMLKHLKEIIQKDKVAKSLVNYELI